MSQWDHGGWPTSMRALPVALLLFVSCQRQPTPEPVPMPTTEPTVLASIRLAPRSPAPGKPPLLILLHGYGADEHDLLDWLESRPAPSTSGASRHRWRSPGRPGVVRPLRGDRRRGGVRSPAGGESRKRLLRFIFEAVAADGADPDRVYSPASVRGPCSRGDRADGAAARGGRGGMSGRISPEVQRAGGRSADALAGLPILVVHGTQDPLLPIENGRSSQAFCRSCRLR